MGNFASKNTQLDVTNGAAHVLQQGGVASIIPSSYDGDLTMNGTAQGVALASGVSLGNGYIYVVNRGATTEAIRIAFGTSELDAEGNLTIATGAATTGHYLPSIADSDGWVILGVPALATHYAIANAVASDVQVVSITQGI